MLVPDNDATTLPHATTTNPGPRAGGPNAERIFALVGGTVLMLAGLLILSRVATAIRSPAQIYEATATFKWSPASTSTGANGLQTAWSLLPADAAVGLEQDGNDPHAYRLASRSSDPGQAVAQTNAFAAGMQANVIHLGEGLFQVVHPADHAVERTGSHGFPGSVVLLLLALAPIYFGARLAFRHQPTSPGAQPL